MWVPGQEAAKPAAIKPAVSIPVTPAPIHHELGPTPSVPTRLLDHILGALCYTLIPAIVFILAKPTKQNRFVRFHSFQAILLAVCTVAIAFAIRILFSLLTLIPVAGYLLAILLVAVVVLAWIMLWLVAVIKALQGESFHLPLIGKLAEKT